MIKLGFHGFQSYSSQATLQPLLPASYQSLQKLLELLQVHSRRWKSLSAPGQPTCWGAFLQPLLLRVVDWWLQLGLAVTSLSQHLCGAWGAHQLLPWARWQGSSHTSSEFCQLYTHSWQILSEHSFFSFWFHNSIWLGSKF